MVLDGMVDTTFAEAESKWRTRLRTGQKKEKSEGVPDRLVNAPPIVANWDALPLQAWEPILRTTACYWELDQKKAGKAQGASRGPRPSAAADGEGATSVVSLQHSRSGHPSTGGARPRSALPSSYQYEASPSRFTREERNCFKKIPTPSSAYRTKADLYWQTTGRVKRSLSESGWHSMPTGKGKFYACAELKERPPRAAARRPHTAPAGDVSGPKVAMKRATSAPGCPRPCPASKAPPTPVSAPSSRVTALAAEQPQDLKRTNSPERSPPRSSRPELRRLDARQSLKPDEAAATATGTPVGENSRGRVLLVGSDSSSGQLGKPAAETAGPSAEDMRLMTMDEQVKLVLESGNVRMLSAKWLIDRPDGWAMVASSDLPPEAFLDGAEAARMYNVLGGLVIVSYPWLSKWHPDPHGFHFRTAQQYLRAHVLFFTNLMKSRQQCVSDFGVFWDYGSLAQFGESGKRTAEEKRMLARSLKGMSLLYGGALTTVVQLRRLPRPFEDMNATPYDQRGWCHFEEAIGNIQKPSNQLLNLSLVARQLESGADWQTLSTAAQVERAPPVAPELLRRQLTAPARRFGAAGDGDAAAGLYRDFFLAVAPGMKALNFQQPAHWTRHWSKKELQSLAATLPHFSACETLSLRGRQLGDAGLAVLAGALPQLGALVELHLNCCSFGDEGLEKLASSLKEMKQLEVLSLHGCRFGEAGLQKLRKEALVLPHLPALEMLTLPEELEHTAEGEMTEALFQEPERLQKSSHYEKRQQIQEVREWLLHNNREKARLFLEDMGGLLGKYRVVHWL